MNHTIVEAIPGEDGCVSKVIIAKVDSNFMPISGTEKELEADTVTLAAGLKPSVELSKLMKCEYTFNGVFGGSIPLHNESMETSIEGIYVAGDSTGVEEANTALEEGKIAGISAAEALGYLTIEEGNKERTEIWKRLDALRMGPFGERRFAEKNNILEEYRIRVGAPSKEELMEVDDNVDD